MKQIKVKEGELRVWHIPQVPGNPFHVSVDSIEEAKKIMDTLGRYDAFEFQNDIKPDYCNTSGLEVMEDGEWVEWYDDDGNDIDAHFEEEE